MAVPVANGSSQARSRIGTAAAGHSNTRSKPHLRPTLQLAQCQIFTLLSEARDRIHILAEAMSGS